MQAGLRGGNTKPWAFAEGTRQADSSHACTGYHGTENADAATPVEKGEKDENKCLYDIECHRVYHAIRMPGVDSFGGGR